MAEKLRAWTKYFNTGQMLEFSLSRLPDLVGNYVKFRETLGNGSGQAYHVAVHDLNHKVFLHYRIARPRDFSGSVAAERAHRLRPVRSIR